MKDTVSVVVRKARSVAGLVVGGYDKLAQGHDCAPALIEAHKDGATVVFTKALWWGPLRARQLGQQAHMLGIHAEAVRNIGQRDIAEPF